MIINNFVIKNGVLKEYTGEGGDVIIPDGVTSISRAFAFCETLKSVSLPFGITSIESHAFWNCENLITVTLPDSITLIDDWAFDGCLNLTKITLPRSLRSIGYEVFNECNKLEVLIKGTPSFDKNSFSCVKKIIAPDIPLSNFLTIKEKRAAAKGFLSSYVIYKNKSIVEEYKKYIMAQKKQLLSEIFLEDDVLSLAVYMEIKKYNIKSFLEEYLQPAEKVNAKKCYTFLLEWEDKNILEIYNLSHLKEIL